MDESFLSESLKPGQSQPHFQEPLFSEKLCRLLQLYPRKPDEPWDKSWKDLAAAAQALLEKALCEIVKDLYRQTGKTKIALAGGVALNCLAMGKISELDFIEDVYIPPGAGDSGISLGAAALCSKEAGFYPKPLQTPYLGPAFENREILKTLRLAQAPYQFVEAAGKAAAEEILQGKVTGWFQGALEFGPRALGGRSILANPSKPLIKDIINSKVKFREPFRPFAPACLLEEKSRFFDSPMPELPFMTITCHVREEWRDKLAGVTHKDGTSRPQTVRKDQHPLFFHLLSRLKKETGGGIVLNTSFNRNREVMACSPREALSAFFGSGMDSCVIGNFLLQKNPGRDAGTALEGGFENKISQNLPAGVLKRLDLSFQAPPTGKTVNFQVKSV